MKEIYQLYLVNDYDFDGDMLVKTYSDKDEAIRDCDRLNTCDYLNEYELRTVTMDNDEIPLDNKNVVILIISDDNTEPVKIVNKNNQDDYSDLICGLSEDTPILYNKGRWGVRVLFDADNFQKMINTAKDMVKAEKAKKIDVEINVDKENASLTKNILDFLVNDIKLDLGKAIQIDTYIKHIIKDETSKAYTNGFKDGEEVGFRDGNNQAINASIDEAIDNGRKVGFEDGYNQGTIDGYNCGYRDCYNDSYYMR